MKTSATLTIRPYRAEDCPVLIAIFQQSIRQLARHDYNPLQIDVWAHDPDPQLFHQKRSSKPSFIAEINGIAAGFSDLENDGHIDMLFVHPDFHHQGVARALLTYSETLARKQLITRLYTEASITARPVFMKCGFSVITEQTVIHREVEFINYRMEKMIPEHS